MQRPGQRVIALLLVTPPTSVSPSVQQPIALPITRVLPTKESPSLGPTDSSVETGEGQPTAPLITDPQIVFFYADAQKRTQGEVTTLRWEVQDATSVIIEPSVGEVSGSGEIPVQPQETTIFTLYATNASSVSHSREVVIEVIQPVVETPQLQPSILNFYAKPSEVSVGNPVELCYETQNAAGVEIQPEIGSLLKLGYPLDYGCVPVTPKDETIVYTLSIYYQGGQLVATREAKLLVRPLN